ARMGQVPRESGTGICHRRLHTGSAWSGLHHRRVLPRRGIDLRRPDAKRLRSGVAPKIIRDAASAGHADCPFVNLPETRKARWGEALTAEFGVQAARRLAWEIYCLSATFKASCPSATNQNSPFDTLHLTYLRPYV